MDQYSPWFAKLGNVPDMPNVHNLFSSRSPDGLTRLSNLRRYFDQVLAFSPRVILIGEAPGYQGTYRTGVPFCSESILLGPKNKFGFFGGPANGYSRVYDGERLWKEPSATIVQRTINELPSPPLVWATFPLHPHRPDAELSNRAPNKDEIKMGAELLGELLAIMKPEQVIAVGNVAEGCLRALGVRAIKVRHPSHGGALLFRNQLLEVLEKE